MTQAKTFTIINSFKEAEMNDFMKSVKVVNVISMGTEKQMNGSEAPKVMVVYERG